ncbi:hypothetical protein [Winogradskyella damuponensis]|uniref:Uncharacterized protein n=1 Tax=Winogradskyella damuponensis TaxID=943939 RepID=A0ABP8D3I1_9FLAO
MKTSQTFRKNPETDTEKGSEELSISLFGINKDTKLKDILAEVEKIHSTYF